MVKSHQKIIQISFAGLIILFLTGLLNATSTRADDQIVFEYPPNDSTTVNKTEEVIIKGFIKKPATEIEKVQISFDGQIWRSVTKDTKINDNFFHWYYPWTAAGKGKNFIQISVKYKNGEEGLGLKMIEVLAPATDDDQNLREFLESYRENILSERNNEKAVQSNKDDLIFMVEYLLNENVGDWIENNWQALFWGKKNLEYSLNLAINYDDFIRKYPIGIDLLSVITWPILILNLLLAVWLIWLEKIPDSWDMLRANLGRLGRNNIGQKNIVVFNPLTLDVVSYAKIIFRSSQGQDYIFFSDRQGEIVLDRLPVETYTWTIFKNGYKKYILEPIALENYRQRQVLKDNVSLTDDGFRLAIPAVAEMGQDRHSKFIKASFIFPIKKWLINNGFSLLLTGLLLAVNLYFYQRQAILLNIVIFILLSCLIWVGLSVKDHWGIIRYKNGKRLAWTELWLMSGEIQVAKTWSDWEGKFAWQGIESGNYQILAEKNNQKIVRNILIDSKGRPREKFDLTF